MKIVNRFFLAGCIASAALAIITFSPSVSLAQDEHAKLDRSKLPMSGRSVDEFIPKGWKLEEKIVGDVNDDKQPDALLKLVEDKPSSEDTVVDKGRALVILFGGDTGAYRLAAVSDSLLQCTACGGAFYGVVPAPADIKVEKGVIIVSQDHGSRDVSETTYRFRYDEQPNMFILIGFDYSDRDRAEGSYWSESTNYVTGKRITSTGKGKRDTKKTSIVKKDRKSIEEIDYEKFEDAAAKRLGID